MLKRRNKNAAISKVEAREGMRMMFVRMCVCNFVYRGWGWVMFCGGIGKSTKWEEYGEMDYNGIN